MQVRGVEVSLYPGNRHETLKYFVENRYIKKQTSYFHTSTLYVAVVEEALSVRFLNFPFHVIISEFILPTIFGVIYFLRPNWSLLGPKLPMHTVCIS